MRASLRDQDVSLYQAFHKEESYQGPQVMVTSAVWSLTNSYNTHVDMNKGLY